MSTFSSWPFRPDPEAVVREHGPAVYRLLKRIFGPRSDVDDAYQTVFVEVLRSLPSFAGKAKMSTWIRRITWNVAYQEMRASYRLPDMRSLEEPGLPVPQTPEPTAVLESREMLRRFHAALELLDPKQRVVVAMHDIEGCTLREMSEALGRPLPTVASQLAAGRARIVEVMRCTDRQGDVLEPNSEKETIR